MAEENEQDAPKNLRSLQDELTELVRRSLAQRVKNDETAERMRQLASQISKLINLARTPPPIPTEEPTAD